MKRLLVIADGMADEACDALGGLTPLAYLHNKHLDDLAAEGFAGAVMTVPEGCDTASETAIPAILGYDPLTPGWGRGMLEAAGLGIELQPGMVAFRINVSSDAVGRWDAEGLASLVDRREDVSFVPLKPGRFLMIMNEGQCLVDCPAPYRSSSGKVSSAACVRAIAPQAEDTARFLNGMITRSCGEVIPWGPSEGCRLIPFSQLHPGFGRGAVISGVPLVNGLGRLAGMECISVAGATGDCDTDYRAKAEAALTALDTHDFVLLHIEAPDEASHRRDARAKLKAISDIAENVVGRLAKELAGRDVRMVFMPDHATSVSTGRHLAGPVPFIVWGRGVGRLNSASRYDESLCRPGPVMPCKGFLERVFGDLRQKEP